MEPCKYRIVGINESRASIRDLSFEEFTPEQESAVLSQAKAQIDPDELEAECAELLRQREQGLLVSAEVLLKKLEEIEGQRDS